MPDQQEIGVFSEQQGDSAVSFGKMMKRARELDTERTTWESTAPFHSLANPDFVAEFRKRTVDVFRAQG